MKKLVLSLLACSALLYSVNLSALQEVEAVVEITPDKPVISLPNPPAEITAQDVLNTSTANKPLQEQVKKAKKSFDELTQSEQIAALKKKIDKVRSKSHSMRAKIRAIKQQVNDLKKELAELKLTQNKPAVAVVLEEPIVEIDEGDDNV